MPNRGPRQVPDRISVTVAGKRLADLIYAVSLGQTITITRYRKPVAVLTKAPE